MRYFKSTVVRKIEADYSRFYKYDKIFKGITRRCPGSDSVQAVFQRNPKDFIEVTEEDYLKQEGKVGDYEIF